MSRLPFVAVALLAAVSSPAAALTLECSINPGSAGGGYVTDVYVFRTDDATGQALAADGWIQHYHGAPISAKVAEDTARKLVLTWTLQMTNSTGQQTKMQYRASYFRQTGKVTVRAVPGGGYGNSFEGRGTCTSR